MNVRVCCLHCYTKCTRLKNGKTHRRAREEYQAHTIARSIKCRVSNLHTISALIKSAGIDFFIDRLLHSGQDYINETSWGSLESRRDRGPGLLGQDKELKCKFSNQVFVQFVCLHFISHLFPVDLCLLLRRFRVPDWLHPGVVGADLVLGGLVLVIPVGKNQQRLSERM